MPERLCLICQKPLADLNHGDVCFCHDVQLTKKDLADLKRKAEEARKEERKAAPRLIQRAKKENVTMSNKGNCSNCERHMGIFSRGLCYTCWNASKGKTGEEREKSLADIKTKIKAGKLKTWGKNRKPKEPMPAAESVSVASDKDQRHDDNGTVSGEAVNIGLNPLSRNSSFNDLYIAHKPIDPNPIQASTESPLTGSASKQTFSAEFKLRFLVADQELFTIPVRVEVV
jgi:hypothetical protein